MNESHRIDDVADDVPTEPELVSIVVQDDDAPDRCTIFHPDSSGVDRMSQWITTETDMLVDLYGVR
jgi:hypothetical protein